MCSNGCRCSRHFLYKLVVYPWNALSHGLAVYLFGPALNGSIPELYPESQVARANGTLKLATTLSILAGMAAAGMAMDLHLPEYINLPSGNTFIALGVIILALLGFTTSFGVYSNQAAAKKDLFPNMARSAQ